MEERKSRINEMMEKARTKAFGISAIIAVVSIAIITMAIWFSEDDDYRIVLIVICALVLIILCYFCYVSLFYTFYQSEKEEYSREECEKYLSSGWPREVTILRRSYMDYNDFFTSLETARFFAKLDDEKEQVIVFIKFENEDFQRKLETIDIEKFLNFYRIKIFQQKEEDD